MVSLHEINEERGEQGRRRSRGADNANNTYRAKGAGVVAEDDTTIDTSSSSNTEKMRKFLLGIGFWVQGLRCFPWLGVNFFLKDGLRVDPSTLQILQSSANLPMVAKPFLGIISDSCFIFGQHRIPYIAIGAILQAVSWLAIAIMSGSGISFFAVTFYLLLSNFGASIAEVANDAIVAETSKEPASSKTSKAPSSGNLQSFVWIASSTGGVLGNLVGGVAIDRFSSRAIFFTFGVVAVIQFLITMCIHERSLKLPKSSSGAGFRKQFSELLAALRKPEISYSIAWFAATFAVVPSLIGTMFFYQTEHLKIESSILGISKVIGQAAMLLWGVIYERYLKSVPARKVITSIQISMAILMLSDILFVKGFYRALGFPDSLYVMIFSGVLEVMMFTKILPFTVLLAQLCPPGCEGSVMAFLMSSVALAMVVSGFFGVALASYFGVTGNNFSGFPMALLLQAACTVSPLYWSYYVPDTVKSKTNGKEN
ncbi:OLC1v1025643C1 [Oldenlandia corymbosa var. corymbosa]|uniref:OLC1v1025643C1 n=1 Tax=Oldenlandia corymbosa var. corymbosa TaxID=529605 RepID=A0AAV1C8B2_OLDCO|nr:OLC1v1025643C1 [Oldenlandia corymbosa var. corymbosa]